MKFNEDHPLNLDFKKKVEDYFEYRWRNDLNQVVRDGDNWKELPQSVQEDIYINFFFDDFIKMHRRTFSFPNWDNCQ